MSDRLKPTPVRIYQGNHFELDGVGVDVEGPVWVVPLGERGADAAEKAREAEERVARRQSLIGEVVRFISGRVPSIFAGHTTPGEVDPYGDDGFDGRVALEMQMDALAGDGRLGDELRATGLLAGSREELRRALDSVRSAGRSGNGKGRNGQTEPVDPLDLVDHDLVRGVNGVFADSRLRDNLGGQTPRDIGRSILEKLLRTDAEVDDYEPNGS